MSDPDEVVSIASAVSQRVRAGTMPPDDAYAWTRVICELVRPQLPPPPPEDDEPMFTNTPTLKLLVLLVLLAGTTTAQAQTVPEPRRTILIDDPLDPTIPSLGSEWLWTYGTNAPAPLPGTPFITEVRLTLTPTSGTGTRIVTLPRAQVTRETVATNCPGGTAPCLRILDVALPVGTFTTISAFVTGAGVEGPASAAIPFSASFPLPVAPRHRFP